MIDIIRHWIPELKQSKTKYVWTAKTCPFCNPKTNSNSFRVNIKLNVYKCYQCGRGGKTIKSFIRHLKKSKVIGYHFYIFGKKIKMTSIESYYGCESYKDTLLPF